MQKALAVFTLFASSTAFAAPPVPPEFWDQRAKLTLARALVGEADWHQPDHVAIAHVLVKRWKAFRHNRPSNIPFADFVKLYSAPLKTKHPRSLLIQALPWDTFAGPGEAPGESWVDWATKPQALGWAGPRWDTVRTFVEDWGQGRVKDPCPQAVHFGGGMDKPGRMFFPVYCGRTRNLFYGIRSGETPSS